MVTGATGLVGGHVVMALLGAGHDVVALARDAEGRSAEDRICALLVSCPGFRAADHRDKLTVIDGDLQAEFCGLLPAETVRWRGRIDVVVHCAASVAFEDSPEVVQAVNVDGVSQVLALTEKLGCPHYVHLSTAYVDQALSGGDCRNSYEESKLTAERLVATWRGRLAIDVVRPSIVTGNSRNGFTPTFHGLYPFLRFCCTFRKELSRLPVACWLPDGHASRAVVNLVPADVVADVIRVAVENNGHSWREINIINPKTWSFDELCGCIQGFLGIEAKLSSDGQGRLPRRAQQTLDQIMATYGDYVDAQPELDRCVADALLSTACVQFPGDDHGWMDALLNWGCERRWRRLV